MLPRGGWAVVFWAGWAAALPGVAGQWVQGNWFVGAPVGQYPNSGCNSGSCGRSFLRARSCPNLPSFVSAVAAANGRPPSTRFECYGENDMLVTGGQTGGGAHSQWCSIATADLRSAVPGLRVGCTTRGVNTYLTSIVPDSDIGRLNVAGLNAPTRAPTRSPTPAPTRTLTHAPSRVPTGPPTPLPNTRFPTAVPTGPPTAAPSGLPTGPPTASPSATPTAGPTALPTTSPTAAPTAAPTTLPTSFPTAAPSVIPTSTPTLSPAATTQTPTLRPSAAPSVAPTVAPFIPAPRPQDTSAEGSGGAGAEIWIAVGCALAVALVCGLVAVAAGRKRKARAKHRTPAIVNPSYDPGSPEPLSNAYAQPGDVKETTASTYEALSLPADEGAGGQDRYEMPVSGYEVPVSGYEVPVSGCVTVTQGQSLYAVPLEPTAADLSTRENEQYKVFQDLPPTDADAGSGLSVGSSARRTSEEAGPNGATFA